MGSTRPSLVYPLQALGAFAVLVFLLTPPLIAQEDEGERDPIELRAVEPTPAHGPTGVEPLTTEQAVPADAREAVAASAPGEPFATRAAWYVPVAWEQIPQWRAEVTPLAWRAFVASCGVLSRQSAWRGTCDRALTVPASDADAALRFFEREFTAFQIRTPDLTDTGILTGYFEPVLEGSRVRTARFAHPIYALPDDLLWLDVRLLARRHRPEYVRIDGREVVPADSPPPRAGKAKLYRLAVWRAPAVTRDQKVRVRASGDRIVPYFTRQEIERRGLGAARALAWVADPDELYTLHIEGSGRIRLPRGEIVRVSYSEQNGHAFRPIVTVAPTGEQRVTLTASTPAQSLINFVFSPAAAAEPPTYPLLDSPLPRISLSSRSDPSYVFFREIPDNDAGPPGAMGIPLTPGGSLAVDPRVIPLGAPVFIATRQPGAAVTTHRLMAAQDTGGAIRGALRADYFLGSGAAASAAAMRMKDELWMWVLLPKDLPQARGGSRRTLRDCVLPDPEFCAE